MNIIFNILTAICVAFIVVSCGGGGDGDLNVSGENNTINVNEGNTGASITNNREEGDDIEEQCLSCLMNENDGVSDCTCLRQKGVTLAQCARKGVNGFADEEECL